LGKIGCWFLKKLKVKGPYDAAVPLLRIYLKELKAGVSNRYLYTHIHSNIIHNSGTVGIMQVSIDRYLDKQNVIHTYNEIVPNL
jgi:hypothetical protein